MAIEDLLTTWAQGPNKTEQDKCANAESVVRTAVEKSGTLQSLSVRVFTQGSYVARTNVRLDSDVDVCVCRYNQFYYDLPPTGSQNPADYGIVPATISFATYKTAVGKALTSHLGKGAVTPWNKAFDVHANTYRIDADVVPAFEYRWYTDFDRFGKPVYHSGIEIVADSGESIINWPQQTYDNGVAKNDRTGRRYKRLIRIMKRLRNAMQEDKVSDADDIASFLIECLAWNTPDAVFQRDEYVDALRGLLAHTFNNTLKQETCNEWGEVNELKYLFRDAVQPWTREKANSFLGAAWDYVGFK